jgi:hypothetical protein
LRRARQASAPTVTAAAACTRNPLRLSAITRSYSRRPVPIFPARPRPIGLPVRHGLALSEVA